MSRPVTVIGAQITQPDALADRPGFLAQLLAIPGVDGLEIPVGSGLYLEDEDWLLPALPEGGSHVLNLIGATMERAASGVGFASPDRVARNEAFELAAHARRLTTQLHGRGIAVTAIVVHSAPSLKPGLHGAAARQLTESLTELASWDWHGARIVLEHCDARQAGHPYVKGFLPLQLELDVLQTLADNGGPVGALINWGRSAIDGRNPETPLEHVRAAADRGLLAGAIVSGVVPVDSVYGTAWSDTHAPARPEPGSAGEPASLLGVQDAADFFQASAAAAFRGVKLSLRPPEASVPDRLAVNAALLTAIPAGTPTA